MSLAPCERRLASLADFIQSLEPSAGSARRKKVRLGFRECGRAWTDEVDKEQRADFYRSRSDSFAQASMAPCLESALGKSEKQRQILSSQVSIKEIELSRMESLLSAEKSLRMDAEAKLRRSEERASQIVMLQAQLSKSGLLIQSLEEKILIMTEEHRREASDFKVLIAQKDAQIEREISGSRELKSHIKSLISQQLSSAIRDLNEIQAEREKFLAICRSLSSLTDENNALRQKIAAISSENEMMKGEISELRSRGQSTEILEMLNELESIRDATEIIQTRMRLLDQDAEEAEKLRRENQRLEVENSKLRGGAPDFCSLMSENDRLQEQNKQYEEGIRELKESSVPKEIISETILKGLCDLKSEIRDPLIAKKICELECKAETSLSTRREIIESREVEESKQQLMIENELLKRDLEEANERAEDNAFPSEMATRMKALVMENAQLNELLSQANCEDQGGNK